MQTSSVPAAIDKTIRSLGSADIVVGIPSFNNAETIGHVVRTVQRGLQQFFPSARSVIINSDGGSSDGTPERVLEALPENSPVLQAPHDVYPVERLSASYTGVPGKGSALRLVFELARSLGARACVVVDPDLSSIQPEWIRVLAQPVLDRGFDLVTPCYLRHRFDATLTDSIVYPLTRALYGARIRQPMGGEFCLSSALIESYLADDVWDTDVASWGIDIWVTTEAVCGGFRICQVFLGPRVGYPNAPPVDLSSMLAQVLGVTFAEMERNVTVWQKIRGTENVPTLGAPGPAPADPVNVDTQDMISSFRIGYENLSGVWSAVLPPATLLDLKRLARRSDAEFAFPDSAWTRIVYDFAVAHHLRAIVRDHLLRALTPLYLGWVASFVLEMQEADAAAVEKRIERLCARYEQDKPYLISRWRWPDRFSP